ncbi:MAG TPA: FtsX-like permease family protein [Candidatus Saccharibacteria bacterium]|nr:FtsX-like permease family protein [Candidatus Saccharibacteria bacterium]
MARINRNILKLNYRSAIASMRQSKPQSVATILSLALAAASLFAYLNLSSLSQIKNQEKKTEIYITDKQSIKYGDIKSKLQSKTKYEYSIFRSCSADKASQNGSEQIKCIVADENLLDSLDLTPEDGQNLDQRSSEDNIVVGSAVAIANFGDPDSSVGKRLTILGKERTIIGLIPSSPGFAGTELSDVDNLVITAITDTNTNDDTLFSLLVKLGNPNDLDMFKNAIGQDITFINPTKDAEDDNLSNDRDRLISSTKQSAIVALVMSGLCVFISSVLSVNKRVREIGIRKTIGATNAHIAQHFIIESLFAGFIGAIVGSVASWSAIVIKFKVGLLYSANYSVSNLLVTLVGVLLVSLLAGIVPAKIAAKKSPIDCLNKAM